MAIPGATFKDSWVSFDAAVVPEDAPQMQRQEMRRAFYGGGWAMVNLMLGATEGNVPDEVGAELLAGWMAEFEAFKAEVEAGRK
jgi:hypothetical protein